MRARHLRLPFASAMPARRFVQFRSVMSCVSVVSQLARRKAPVMAGLHQSSREGNSLYGAVRVKGRPK
jgi:hypothetical protein